MSSSGPRHIARTFFITKNSDNGERVIAKKERPRMVLAVENDEDFALHSNVNRLKERLARTVGMSNDQEEI
ncbi:hypothetical protein [Tateyamaria omphalii]|uniref:Uncharacterized protein n=1 Tax=Tateyamaria omphalii TaxID=299262 RepID=A0A1P8MXS9_9RHOB|nr:hypothetical protein [Tateyamaria omphalii]APX12818.1 hypothetical protein BWR18_14825 [Tateyamaria omphalii]